jgi:hypothetical protein
MKKVISIENLESSKSNPIKLIDMFVDRDKGWTKTKHISTQMDKLIHLGSQDGLDYFIAYSDLDGGVIYFRGNLNDGTY